MIRLSGKEPDEDIAIEIVGRRPGEKIHEELFKPGERPQPTPAEKIVAPCGPGSTPNGWRARSLASRSWSTTATPPPSAGAVAAVRGACAGQRAGPGREHAGRKLTGPFRAARRTVHPSDLWTSSSRSGRMRPGGHRGLAVMSALYFSQARDVKRLREWAGRAPERSDAAARSLRLRAWWPSRFPSPLAPRHRPLPPRPAGGLPARPQATRRSGWADPANPGGADRGRPGRRHRRRAGGRHRSGRRYSRGSPRGWKHRCRGAGRPYGRKAERDRGARGRVRGHRRSPGARGARRRRRGATASPPRRTMTSRGRRPVRQARGGACGETTPRIPSRAKKPPRKVRKPRRRRAGRGRAPSPRLPKKTPGRRLRRRRGLRSRSGPRGLPGGPPDPESFHEGDTSTAPLPPPVPPRRPTIPIGGRRAPKPRAALPILPAVLTESSRQASVEP